MRVAVIGSGAREHAIVYKLQMADSVKSILAIPGNDAMARTMNKVILQEMPKDDELCYKKLAASLRNQGTDYVIIGPEKPLVEGLADIIREQGIPVFGPSKIAAQLEGSKEFAKEFMKRHNIPTARYEAFTNPVKAIEYIKKQGAPIVIKADGLAAGKGVVVAQTEEEAIDAVNSMLVEHEFSCNRVVIEEFLEGEEVTLLNFSDGTNFAPMVAAQDHKRIFDGDLGPNTGGMGAYAPAPVLTEDLRQQAIDRIVRPTIEGMKADGMPFVGCLYAGLIITKEGPKVIEYNVRFGDPETQVILPLLDTDFGEVIKACCEGNLDKITVNWKNGSVACVVLASEGYPQSPMKGREITGDLGNEKNTFIFHAGTKFNEEISGYITDGGRVLGITAYAESLIDALKLSYNRIENINFKGMQFRKDIGQKALK